MTRFPTFLSLQEWPINFFMLQNNKSERNHIYTYVPHQLRTKYYIELRAVFKIIDIRVLTLPSSDISSKVHG